VTGLNAATGIAQNQGTATKGIATITKKLSKLPELPEQYVLKTERLLYENLKLSHCRFGVNHFRRLWIDFLWSFLV
jgi:hypothetical protein